jgi:hypothetical protein
MLCEEALAEPTLAWKRSAALTSRPLRVATVDLAGPPKMSSSESDIAATHVSCAQMAAQ